MNKQTWQTSISSEFGMLRGRTGGLSMRGRPGVRNRSSKSGILAMRSRPVDLVDLVRLL